LASRVVEAIALTGVFGRRSESISKLLTDIVERDRQDIGESEVVRLFEARDKDFAAVCEAADHVRASVVAMSLPTSSIATSTTRTSVLTAVGFVLLKGNAAARERKSRICWNWTRSAKEFGSLDSRATEVCLQGGIHPSFTGETYISILRAVKKAVPAMHVHAFSPLESCMERLHSASA